MRMKCIWYVFCSSFQWIHINDQFQLASTNLPRVVMLHHDCDEGILIFFFFQWKWNWKTETFIYHLTIPSFSAISYSRAAGCRWFPVIAVLENYLNLIFSTKFTHYRAHTHPLCLSFTRTWTRTHCTHSPFIFLFCSLFVPFNFAIVLIFFFFFQKKKTFVCTVYCKWIMKLLI